MRGIITTIFSVILLALLAPAGGAAESEAGFSARPMLPDNQEPGSEGYFDLRVTPGMRQTLTMEIENTRDTDITVRVTTLTATTNHRGEIEYANQGRSDESLRHSLTDMTEVRGGEFIIIAPGERVHAAVDMAVPAEPFDGIILGSISVANVLSDEELARANGNISVHRSVFAVRLRMNDHPVAADFVLGDIYPTAFENAASVAIDIRNPMPAVFANATVSAQIFTTDSEEPVYANVFENVAFAPNSIYPVLLNDGAGGAISPGSYLAKVQIEHGGRVWDLSKQVSFSSRETSEINNYVRGNRGTGFISYRFEGLFEGNLPIIIAIVSAFVLLLMLIVALPKRPPSKQEPPEVADVKVRPVPKEVEVPPIYDASSASRKVKVLPVPPKVEAPPIYDEPYPAKNEFKRSIRPPATDTPPPAPPKAKPPPVYYIPAAPPKVDKPVKIKVKVKRKK